MIPKFLFLVISFFTFILSSASLPLTDGQPGDITDNSLAAINNETFTIQVDIPIGTTDASGNIIAIDTFSGMAELKCETSLASPFLGEIEAAASKLDHGGWCGQFNAGGSRCTEWAQSGGAKIAFCGAVLAAVRCKELGWAANVIRTNCAWNDRAGGQWRYRDIPVLWGKAIVY
jgi:hypothetical protein